jgi:hypothetical protein
MPLLFGDRKCSFGSVEREQILGRKTAHRVEVERGTEPTFQARPDLSRRE